MVDEIDRVSRKALGELLDPFSKAPLFEGPVEDRRTPLPEIPSDIPVKEDQEAILRWILGDVAAHRRPLTPMELSSGLGDLQRQYPEPQAMSLREAEKQLRKGRR